MTDMISRAALLDSLQSAVSPEEWAELEAGALPVGDFNRRTLLEMRSAAVDSGDAVLRADVEGLRHNLENYLGRYLADNPAAWKWIVLSSLYLTFVAGRPMHPIDLVKIRVIDGAYHCPAKSDAPDAACRYCVCRFADKH